MYGNRSSNTEYPGINNNNGGNENMKCQSGPSQQIQPQGSG